MIITIEGKQGEGKTRLAGQIENLLLASDANVTVQVIEPAHSTSSETYTHTVIIKNVN